MTFEEYSEGSHITIMHGIEYNYGPSTFVDSWTKNVNTVEM